MDETLGEPSGVELNLRKLRKKSLFLDVLLIIFVTGLTAALWALATFSALFLVPIMGLKEAAACTVGGFAAGWFLSRQKLE